MSTWATRRRRPRLELYPASGSPTLLFHKWHVYDVDQDDGPVLDGKNSRLDFLTAVATRVNALTGGPEYERWHRRYHEALTGLDSATQWITASTLWRLVTGLATNPALETGLTLHPLHGFPYLPGSTVRGLVRRAAESDLTADFEPWMERLATGDFPPDEEISAFLDRTETVRTLFGSLIVESPDGYDPGWTLPLELLQSLRQAVQTRPEDDPLRQRLDRLLGGFTGGLLTFFDAVPQPGQQDLLELDVLNPHYPRFYRAAKKRQVPSDDQDPIPVHFLAVKAETAFVFPFQLGPLPQGEPTDSRDELTRKVSGWLETALSTLGAGAKTAAGYGYFQSFDSAPLQKGVESTKPAPE